MKPESILQFMAGTQIIDILLLAQKLIKVPSVTGDQDKALEVLEIAKKELADFHYTPFVSNGYPSLLYSNVPNSKHFKLILNAHLDVVPGLTKQFKPYVQDGKLYGRGAYDMKAAAAALILLYKELANNISFPFALQLVTDEEVASTNGTLYQIQQGITADFVIVGESGSDLRINRENKGIVIIELTTQGVTSHAAYPWKGKNAIMRMYEVLAMLQQAFPHPTAETFETTLSVTKIHTTNTVWNKIPNNCTATVDIRVNSEQSKTIHSQLKAVLPHDVTMTVIQERTPFATDPNNFFLSVLQESGKQVTGSELRLARTFGWADAALFHDIGSSACEFGPTGNGSHDDDEHVNIKSLEYYYKILNVFIKSINN